MRVRIRHTKLGKPPSLKVTYTCGLRRFEQWVCPEHPGYAGHKANLWWQEMGTGVSPQSVDEALARESELRKPAKIRVWINTKHPEVLAYEL